MDQDFIPMHAAPQRLAACAALRHAGLHTPDMCRAVAMLAWPASSSRQQQQQQPVVLSQRLLRLMGRWRDRQN